MWLPWRQKCIRKRPVLLFLFGGKCAFFLFYSYSTVSRDRLQGLFSNSFFVHQTPLVPYGSPQNRTISEDFVTSPFIVNTPTCKIPYFDPWDESVKMLGKKCKPVDEAEPRCLKGGGRNWMYTQGSTLSFNYSDIKKSGYSMNSIRCCYYVIHRVQQSLENFDRDADNIVRLSEECYPIPPYGSVTVEAEFIRVFCVSTSWPLFQDPVYKAYFAIPQPDTHALKKITQWSRIPDTEKPPSVIIVGVDGNSRLNSHRRLPLTLKTLQELGAKEMLGYTKVGENTLPNNIAFLGGTTFWGMLSHCYPTYPEPTGTFDSCPFIWKDFDRAGYLTATVEESPWACAFNAFGNGFVMKPTDFYYRPFTIDAFKKHPREHSYHKWFAKCIGNRLSPEVLLSYMADIQRWGSLGAPVFIHGWLEVFSHECINSVRFQDTAIAKFMETVDKTNTILILMSDHGDRYGAFRETTLGWYEDKLPTLWVYLPDTVRKRHPEWNQALEINSRRLTSHFDLYQTFIHILEEYSMDPEFRVRAPKKRIGQSLFEVVSENRTCSDVGIPTSYCACTAPKQIAVNRLSVNEAGYGRLYEVVNATMLFLNTALPPECAKFDLKEIEGAKQMNFPDGEEMYVVSFYTVPGDFLFEATVKIGKSRDGLLRDNTTIMGDVRSEYKLDSLQDILRMNKMTRQVKCIHDPILERYCYCF